MDRKTFQASVAASIIASLLVILFVQPFLSWFWEVFVSGSNLTIAYLSNSVYKNAALGHRNWVSAAIAIFLLSAIGAVGATKLVTRLLPESWLKKTKEFLSRGRGGPVKALAVITDLFGLFALVYLMTVIYADIQLGASFEQRLTVLDPHLSDQEVQEIRASWASMRSRQDYEQIVAQMEKVANSKGVKLPQLLLQ